MNRYLEKIAAGLRDDLKVHKKPLKGLRGVKKVKVGQVLKPHKKTPQKGSNRFLKKTAQDWDPRFQPDLTPDQMKALGVLAKQYFNKDPVEGNYFHVDASLNEWPDQWLDKKTAPHGWFQWYQGYAAGNRTPDDERQIKRWISFKARHLAQLKKQIRH